MRASPTAGQVAERIGTFAGACTVADLSRTQTMRGGLGRGMLPVAPALGSVLPGGHLERGRMYGCSGDAPVSLLFALVAAATQEGSWFAMVDMEHAGLQSAHEHGVALQRTLCISSGGPRTWPAVTGALVDGIDIVAVASPSCRSSDARRLAARVKSSGAVLFVLGRRGDFEVDIVMNTRTVSWHFDLHAEVRTVEVSASGRRVHAVRPRTIRLPGACGAAQATNEPVDAAP